MTTINIYDPVRNYKLHQDEYDAVLNKILLEGRYINGPEVMDLEKNLCEYTGSNYCIGVSSGTDALLLALMCLDIQEGDEIITTPFTWISTSEVISLLKAKPVFVDINPDTFNIDENLIEEKITDKTKVILPVSIFGKMCNSIKIMEIAKKYNLKVIEDAAQSLGSRFHDTKSCSWADISCTSFYPTKSLGCFGDGGACFTNNKEYYLKIKALKDHGCLQRHSHSLIGINGRLDTIQAGILNVKMKYFDSDLNKRRKNADIYYNKLGGCKNITLPFHDIGDYHIYSQFTIKVKNLNQRESLLLYLKNNNINVSVFYPKPLHLQECFSYLNYKEGDFKISEQVGDYVLSLPVYPELTTHELDTVINHIQQWDSNYD